jgi:hypothetical protein
VAYLEITLTIDKADRSSAASVYQQYKQPFLESVCGATSNELLVREKDVQVLHGFDTTAHAREYLSSELFTEDVVFGYGPLLTSQPEIRIYETA